MKTVIEILRCSNWTLEVTQYLMIAVEVVFLVLKEFVDIFKKFIWNIPSHQNVFVLN